MNLFYRPKNAWVGDLIPYWEDGQYYAFYLHDPRIKKGEYAEETTWYLVTTRDFVNFTEHGEAIARGGDNQPNKNIYTGSVIKGIDGLYYAYYTAFNDQYRFNGESRQSIMVAKGKDLFHLETDESFIFQADDKLYGNFDWRDPFVFWNEEEHCYWMLLAARLKSGGSHRGGCIALCKSVDLKRWDYAEPFYAPNMYITMECPELFYMNGFWYLVFSTFSDRFVTHYRMSRSLGGPWIIPAQDSFDSRANYAIKTASDGKRRFAFGWIASKSGAVDQGDWDWGGTMMIHEIKQDPATRLLRVAPPEAPAAFYSKKQPVESWSFFNAEKIPAQTGCKFRSHTLGAALTPVHGDCFALDLELEVGGESEFGIALHTDPGMENGYFLRMDSVSGIAAWDLWPRISPGKYQWQIAGDKPYMLETAVRFKKRPVYRFKIIREKEIAVVYINGETVLSAPLYNFKGGYGGPYIVQDEMHIRVCTINTLN
ncbi:MAG: family 43 glycosylhydrolase [Treponema sp.]|jgi:beta-fructofuranosidase|nr:family 43 glycosylhydrolase [Treponema sp.]